MAPASVTTDSPTGRLISTVEKLGRLWIRYPSLQLLFEAAEAAAVGAGSGRVAALTGDPQDEPLAAHHGAEPGAPALVTS